MMQYITSLCSYRYLFIRSRGRWNLSMSRTKFVIVGVYIAGIVVFIPNYTLTKLEPIFYQEMNITVYRIKSLEIYLRNSSTMNAVNVWIFILIGKLIPCILICILGFLLLKTIRRSVQLTESLKLTACSRRMRAHRRTTILLLAIMTMFVISELPCAILVLISVFVERFFHDYYPLFADTLDIISLVNNAINFVMFCSMSKQFRDSLCETLPFCQNINVPNGYQSAPTTTNVKASAVTQLWVDNNSNAKLLKLV